MMDPPPGRIFPPRYQQPIYPNFVPMTFTLSSVPTSSTIGVFPSPNVRPTAAVLPASMPVVSRNHRPGDSGVVPRCMRFPAPFPFQGLPFSSFFYSIFASSPFFPPAIPSGTRVRRHFCLFYFLRVRAADERTRSFDLVPRPRAGSCILVAASFLVLFPSSSNFALSLRPELRTGSVVLRLAHIRATLVSHQCVHDVQAIMFHSISNRHVSIFTFAILSFLTT
jgi:hypothetical protein